MSIIISNTLKGTNIKNELIKMGAIHSGDLYSPKRKTNVHFDYLLDYRKCNNESAEQYKTSLSEKYPDMSDNDLEQCLLMPITFIDSNNDIICWYLNHSYNDTPAFMISQALPEIIMNFVQRSEGHLVQSICIKNGQLATQNGEPAESVLYRLNKNCIKDIDAKTVRIALPIDNSDKYFAQIYVPKANLRGEDFKNSNNLRYIYDIQNLNDTVKVYRTLKAGNRIKETITWSELIERHTKAIENYKYKMAKKTNTKMT